MQATLRATVRRFIPARVRPALRVVLRLPVVIDRWAKIRRRMSLRVARGAPHTILSHPLRPRLWDDYTLTVIACRLGLRITADPTAACAAAIHWRDATHRPPNPVLERLASSVPVINLWGNDISKTRVEEVMRQVFGYGLAVDPLTTAGPLIEKSDLNALHDARILVGPLPSRREGCVYQRLIGRRRGDFVEEFRIPVVGNRIPFVLLKYKRPPERLALSIRGTIAAAQSVLDETEIERLLAFSRGMGINFGELDVIRDDGDGRLHLLDANNTPSTRFAGFSPAGRQATIDQLAEAFEAAFLGGSNVASGR